MDRQCRCCANGELERRRALFGDPAYDPHGGFAAMRLEADFQTWVAMGNDPSAFAARPAGSDLLSAFIEGNMT